MTINENIHSNKAIDLNNQMNHTKQDHFSALPYEIVLHIFSYLSVGDLSRSMSVSTQWRECGKEDVLWRKLDLNATFESKLGPVQDRSAVMWEISDKDSSQATHDKKPSQATRLNGYALCKLLKGCLNGNANLPIQQNAGVTVITMPKGMTLQKIMDFMHDKGMNIFRTSAFDADFWKSLDNKPNPHTYTFVMTNDLLEESSGKNRAKQMSKFNSHLPTITEAIAYFVTISLPNPQQQPQGISPYASRNLLTTFVRCLSINKESMMVGRLGSNNLCVQTLDVYAFEKGVGGVWRKDHPALSNQSS